MTLDIALHSLAATLAYVRPEAGHTGLQVALLRTELAATTLAGISGEDDPTMVGPRLEALAHRLLSHHQLRRPEVLAPLVEVVRADLWIIAGRLGQERNEELMALLAP